MTCINLRELFGEKYRVSIDRESAEGPRDQDPWVQEMRCRRGLIYPYSATHLAVQVDYHRFIAKRLARLGLKLIQNGGHEKTFVFTTDRFDEVKELVRPYARRYLSEERRQEAIRRLVAYQTGSRRPGWDSRSMLTAAMLLEAATGAAGVPRGRAKLS